MTAEARHEALVFEPLAVERFNAAAEARHWAEEHAR